MIWASTYITNLRRIVTLQKRVIRIINKSKFDDHSSPIFKSLGITKFLDIRLIQLGQFMYCYLNCLLPNKFNHIFFQHIVNNTLITPDMLQLSVCLNVEPT